MLAKEAKVMFTFALAPEIWGDPASLMLLSLRWSRSNFIEFFNFFQFFITLKQNNKCFIYKLFYEITIICFKTATRF